MLQYILRNLVCELSSPAVLWQPQFASGQLLLSILSASQWDSAADDLTSCCFLLTFYPLSCTKALPGPTTGAEMMKNTRYSACGFICQKQTHWHLIRFPPCVYFSAVILNPVSKLQSN